MYILSFQIWTKYKYSLLCRNILVFLPSKDNLRINLCVYEIATFLFNEKFRWKRLFIYINTYSIQEWKHDLVVFQKRTNSILIVFVANWILLGKWWRETYCICVRWSSRVLLRKQRWQLTIADCLLYWCLLMLNIFIFLRAFSVEDGFKKNIGYLDELQRKQEIHILLVITM